jgi:general secretion pathway protein N
MRTAILAGLLGVCALLVAAIAYQIAVPLDSASGTVYLPKISPPSLPATAVFAPRPITFYADIDARPVFAVDRKPLPDQDASGQPASSISDFSLVGVLISGTRAIALIKSKSDNATNSVAVGDMVSGWRVAKILPTSVVLRANGSEQVVELAGPSSAPPSAPLAATAVPPAQASPAPAEAASEANTIATSTAAAKPVTPSKPRPSVVKGASDPAGHKIDPSISPNVKGLTYDPQTGEPTL